MTAKSVIEFSSDEVELVESEFKSYVGLFVNESDVAQFIINCTDFDMMFRFAEETSKWMEYIPSTGTWRESSKDMVIAGVSRVLSRTCEVLSNSQDQERFNERYLSQLKKAALHRSMIPILKDAVRISIDEFDNNPYLFNFKNKVIDFDKKTTISTDPDMLSTKKSNVSIDWNEFMDACKDSWRPVSDEGKRRFDAIMSAIPEDSREYLLYYIATGMIGRAPDHILHLHGSGANGKSSLIALIRRVLGDGYSVSSTPSVLTSSERSRFSKFRLQGARCVFFEELPKDRYMDENQIKQLVDTPRMTAERKGIDEVSFKVQFSIIVATNNLLQVSTMDPAITRRLMVIPTPYRFTRNPQEPHERLADPSLSASSIDNLPDDDPLLQYATQVFIRYGMKLSDNDFVIPVEPSKTMEEAKQEWLGGSDKIQMWIDDCLEECDSRIYSSKIDLYESYCLYVKKNGYVAPGSSVWRTEVNKHQWFTSRGLKVARTRIGEDMVQSRWTNPVTGERSQVTSKQPEIMTGIRIID